jgi:hypothetical protein
MELAVVILAGPLSAAPTSPDVTSKDILAIKRKSIVMMTLPNLIPMTAYLNMKCLWFSCFIGLFFQKFRAFY